MSNIHSPKHKVKQLLINADIKMADDNVAAVLHKVDDIRLDACSVPEPGPDQVTF